MNRRTVLIGCLSASAMVVALPGYGAEAGRRARSVFEGVAGLDKPVTYTETKIPLGEIIAKVAADTGVSLTAAKDVADEPVAVVVKEMPARELLEQIAALLDYRWARRGSEGARGREGVGERGSEGAKKGSDPTPNAQRPTPAFEIYQDLAGKQEEEALRRGLSEEVEKRFHGEVALRAELAALAPERLREMVEAFDRQQEQWMKLPAKERSALRSAPSHQAQLRRAGAARQLVQPTSRALAIFLGRLSRAEWVRLKLEPVTFSTAPQARELPLPAEITRLLRASPPVIYAPGMRFADPASEQDARQREKEAQAQWIAADGYRIRLQFDTTDLRDGGAMALSVDAAPIRDAPAGGRTPLVAGGGTANVHLYAPAVDWQKWQREQTPERNAELERDPVVGVLQRFQPTAKPPPHPENPQIPPEWRLRDLYPDLARTYGVNIIADAYANNAAGSVSIQSFPTEPVALFTLLDRNAAVSHRWDRRGPLIRLRDRSWFLDRPREVPLRLLRRWQATIDENGMLPFETCVEMASRLTDTQLTSLDEWQRGLSPRTAVQTISEIYFVRHLLRLYAALSPPYQEALQRGSVLPVVRMTAPQRALFLAALQEQNLHRNPKIDLEHWVFGSFALSHQRLLRTIEVRDQGFSTTTVPLPPGVAAAPPPPGAPARTPYGPARSIVGRVQFKLQTGPEQTENIDLSVTPLP